MIVCPLSRPNTDTVYHFAGIGCKGSFFVVVAELGLAELDQC